MKLNYY